MRSSNPKSMKTIQAGLRISYYDGIQHENFEVVEPSARELGRDIIDASLESLQLVFPSRTSMEPVTFDLIQETLPVLCTLMENGRMASIACKILRNHDDPFGTLDESQIVRQIIDLYIESNGMKEISKDATRKKSFSSSGKKRMVI